LAPGFDIVVQERILLIVSVVVAVRRDVTIFGTVNDVIFSVVNGVVFDVFLYWLCRFPTLLSTATVAERS
jgi:hypothetical protein